MQSRFFGADSPLRTKVIRRLGDFDRLFEGFTSLQAISYVSSPVVLLRLLDRGYESVELLVGDSLAGKQLKDDLSQRPLEAVDQLATEIERGRVRLLVPKKTVHTKLYLLQKETNVRVILTSANLTETARRAANQVNYAWYIDISDNHPFYQEVRKDFGAHLVDAELFMGDLLELLQQPSGIPREQVIQVWLGSGPSGEMASESQQVVQNLSLNALLHAGRREEEVLTVELPDSTTARKQVERLLPIIAGAQGTHATVAASELIRYIDEKHGVPIMRMDGERDVWLGTRHGVERLSHPWPSSDDVSQALRHVEDYVDTVDLGEASDPLFAKTSIYEALLYMMAAPFAHEHMKQMRYEFGLVDRRGPRFLYIYGPSQNGKTTFLRFVLNLMTGRHVNPMTGASVTPARVRNAAAFGTMYPLVFDDLLGATSPRFEEVVKSYWEVWWTDDLVCPQLVFSSNSYNLRDWAKSRVKRVDFDVHFVPTTENKQRLNSILQVRTELFGWFLARYMALLALAPTPNDDELALARQVMIALYDHAERPLPDYFPREPIENIYDPDLRLWREIVYRLNKAAIHWERDQATVTFSDDMQPIEVREYQATLPQIIKARRRGNTLIIDNPVQLRRWLESSGPKRRAWWRRPFRR